MAVVTPTNFNNNNSGMGDLMVTTANPSCIVDIVLPCKETIVTDDDSAVSSLTDASSDETPPPPPSSAASVGAPRSIFKSYWTKEGGAPEGTASSPTNSIPRRCPPSPRAVSDYTNAAATTTTTKKHHHHDPFGYYYGYEHTLSDVEQPQRTASTTKPIKSSSRQSSWLSSWSVSLPTLHDLYVASQNDKLARKTSSDSKLVVKPLRSCLRPCRYSGKGASSSSSVCSSTSSTSCSVSFDPVIHIHNFQKPVESFAMEGWSNWFTYNPK